jgi:hypothetical protein
MIQLAFATRMLPYIMGTGDQELRRNGYFVAENRILRTQDQTRPYIKIFLIPIFTSS